MIFIFNWFLVVDEANVDWINTRMVLNDDDERPTSERRLSLMTRFRPKHAAGVTSAQLKETLRRACVDRARRKRQDIMVQRRKNQSSVPPSGRQIENVNDENTANDNDMLPAAQTLDSDLGTAEMVIEEELREQGRWMNGTRSSCGHGVASMENAALFDDEPFLNEDDIYDLLQEVEAELSREGMTILKPCSVEAIFVYLTFLMNE